MRLCHSCKNNAFECAHNFLRKMCCFSLKEADEFLVINLNFSVNFYYKKNHCIIIYSSAPVFRSTSQESVLVLSWLATQTTKEKTWRKKRRLQKIAVVMKRQKNGRKPLSLSCSYSSSISFFTHKRLRDQPRIGPTWPESTVFLRGRRGSQNRTRPQWPWSLPRDPKNPTQDLWWNENPLRAAKRGKVVKLLFSFKWTKSCAYTTLRIFFHNIMKGVRFVNLILLIIFLFEKNLNNIIKLFKYYLSPRTHCLVKISLIGQAKFQKITHFMP